MTALYFINAFDIWLTWGMFPPEKKGFFGSLFKAPERKFGLTKNWADQNGTQRALSKITYPSRDLELTFILCAGDKYALLDRYNAFRAFILANPTFTFKAVEQNRLFTFRYVAMPTFNKLTSFNQVVQGNEMICVEFTISFIAEYPTTFLYASGGAIPLTFPEPTPDVPVNLEDFNFKIVGDYVVMENDDIDGFDLKLDGNSSKLSYGLIPKKGFQDQLFKIPEPKSEIEGVFESRALDLSFYLTGENEADFYAKYYSLVGFLLDSGYFNLDVVNINKRFSLLYQSMPALNQLTLIKGSDRVVAELTISLLDDAPTQNGGVNQFDGRFIINENGDLVYTQLDYWDDKISVSLTEDGDLIINIL